MGAPDWIFDFTGIRVAAIFSVPTGFGAEYPILGALRNTKSQKEHFVIAPVFRLKFVTLHEVIRESRHMNNLYEERLGTDRMLPLVFRMALPAVAAQIVNLLYNIVDRIYIGHIPGIGTDALAGIGVTSSVIILISCLLLHRGGGRRTFGCHRVGAGRPGASWQDIGERTGIAPAFHRPDIGHGIPVHASPADGHRGIGTYDRLCDGLFVGVFVGDVVRGGLGGAEHFHQYAGKAGHSHVLGRHRRAAEHRSRSAVHFRVRHGGERGGLGHYPLAGLQCLVGVAFPDLAQGHVENRAEVYASRQENHRRHIGLGRVPVHHGQYGKSGGFCAEQRLESVWRHLYQRIAIMQSAMLGGQRTADRVRTRFIPIVSYNYGHGNRERVKDCFKIVVRVMFSFNLLLVLFMILFPGLVASAFTSDERLIATVEHTLPVFLAGMTIFGLQRACQNMFVALGQAKVSVFIALLRKVILLVPLALLLPRWMGVMGVYARRGCFRCRRSRLLHLDFCLAVPENPT